MVTEAVFTKTEINHDLNVVFKIQKKKSIKTEALFVKVMNTMIILFRIVPWHSTLLFQWVFLLVKAPLKL